MSAEITTAPAPTIAPSDADRWVVGWNMPGYSPDPDNVTPYADWADARQHLVETCEHFWDQDAEHSDLDDADERADARWLPLHAALHTATPNQPFSHQIDAVPPLVFWIQHIES